MTMRKATFLILALLLTHMPAVAWDDTGHMVVASIAYNRLTPAARAKIDQLLIPPPPQPGVKYPDRGFVFFCERLYGPVTIACWMDDIRDSSLSWSYAEWHYINFNPVFIGIPADERVGPAKENILVRIKFALEELGKRKDFAATTSRSDDRQSAEALGYLYHLVGDVHQPLHCATRYTAARPNGDSGGNGFPIAPPVAKGPDNLHAYWDAAAGLFNFVKVARPPTSRGTEPPAIKKLAAGIVAAYPAGVHAQQARELDPEQWVKESNQLAREFAYVRLNEKDKPAGAYATEAKKIATARLALAGYRLAEVLNRIYQ